MAEGRTTWERFKGLLRDCPHHNQTNEVLAHTFIEGLHPETNIVVDAAVGGQVLEKSFNEIYALLNKFSKSNPDWQGEMGRHMVQKSARVLELDIVSALSSQISTLTNQVNQMTLVINKQQAQPVQYVQVFCEVCGEGHTSDLCPVNPESVCFVVGALPSDTEANPKASINVVSLRNGRQLEEVQSKKRKQVTFNEKPATIELESEKSKESEKPAEKAVAKQPPPLVVRPPPPFPQRLQKVKDNTAYKRFLNILKQVQINIPLVDILQEVPKYAKYIKDIVANKMRLTEFKTVALTEECSSRIQSKLPQKLKDPGNFTIQISIGKHAVGRALCDLGASINLMPLSVFRQLGLGEPRPTTVILQLADHSLAHSEGMIEDVLVQVGSFIFPVDFIILDYEPDQEVPFILWRPFLATGRAIIDVYEAKMMMRVCDQVEVFNMYKALRLPAHYEELSMISVVESNAMSLMPYMSPIDPLERALIGNK
nr:uncharacterized protein LOC104109611 [Nicotiana tomentosiformis]